MSEREQLSEMLQGVGVEISEDSLDQLLWFRDELLRWNRKINLTAISDPGEALEKHLVDSLSLLPYLRPDGNLLDMGSGGGFPCIPLKIVQKSILVWSVDAVAKKIAFQKHVGRALKLEGFTPFHARLEDLPKNPELPPFDMIVARAFAPLEDIISLAEPLLAPGGQVIAMKGADGLEEATAASQMMEEAGFACKNSVQLQLPQSKAKRVLLFIGRS